MQFKASWDNIETNRAWSRPQLGQLISWWRDINNLHSFDKYDVYLVGGFAEYLNNPTLPMTWDMDICLVSNEFDYSELKAILDDSLKLAIKYNFLIDIKGVPLYMWDFFQKLHLGKIPSESDLDKENFYLIRNYKSFSKYIDGKLEREFALNDKQYSNWVEVYPNLYKDYHYYTELYTKVVEKFNSKSYVGRIVNLKTTDFNFVT